jgi:hypothetical protein
MTPRLLVRAAMRLSMLLASGFAASAALAQSNIHRMVFEASTDNEQSWSSRADVQPGQEVLIRMRMQLLNPTTDIIGFAGMTYQPTLSNWHPESSDQAVIYRPPRDFPPYDNGVPGRIFPFRSVGMGSASASGQLTTFNDPGNILRISGATTATTPTTNLAWGLNSTQLTRQLGGTSFAAGTDVVVFKYAVTLGDSGQERTLVAGAPLAYIHNQRATWFRTENGSNSLLYTLTAEDIVPAEIHVIPAPASALLGLLALVPRRRRRA